MKVSACNLFPVQGILKYQSKKLLLTATILLTAGAIISGCSSSTAPGSAENGDEEFPGNDAPAQFAMSCEGDVFVSGVVKREFHEFSWNEPFVPTAEAHVRIRMTTFLFDGPSVILSDRDVEFVQLPFDFAICGDAEVFEEARLGEIAVSVDIFNHEGNDPRVGDLTSEFLNSIDGATSNLEILVSGLEDCDSPEAGGFCTSSR